MKQPLNSEGMNLLFTEARTYSAWLPQPVSEDTLHRLYELLKFGPTSANCTPARFLFVKSEAAKAKLLPCMDKGNVEKTRTAPVTAIIAFDTEFYEQMPRLFPHANMKPVFADNKKLAEQTAFRNGSLQGAYFILAARSLGLDCGPMSGFDNDKVDSTFFKGTTWKSNFICNLGYGDATKLHPRNPRLPFDEACSIV